MTPLENEKRISESEATLPVTRMPLIDLPRDIIELLSEHPQFPRVYGLDNKPIAGWSKLTVGDRGEFIPYVEVKNNEIVGFGVEQDSRPGVVIIPMHITPEGSPEFYMIRQERVFLMQSKTGKSTHKFANLAFPQGLMDSDETSLRASTRELIQETGLIPKSIFHLGSKYINQSVSSTLAYFELALVEYETNQNPEAHLEAGEVIRGDTWRTLHELKGISLDTMDMRTTVAITYTDWLLSKQFPELLGEETTL